MTCELATLEERWLDDTRPAIPATEIVAEAACSAPIDAQTVAFLSPRWARPGRGALEVTLAPDDAWIVVDGQSGWWQPPAHTFRWQLAAGLHLVQFGALGETHASGAFLADVRADGVDAWVAGLGFDGATAAWPCDGDPEDFVAQLASLGARDEAIATVRMGDAAMACSGASEALRHRFDGLKADVWTRNGFGDGVVVAEGPWTRQRRAPLAAAHAWSVPGYLLGLGGVALLFQSTVITEEVSMFLPFVGYAALGVAVAERQSLQRAGVHVPLHGVAIGGVGVVAGLMHPVGTVIVPLGALLQVGMNEAAMAHAHRLRRAEHQSSAGAN